MIRRSLLRPPPVLPLVPASQLNVALSEVTEVKVNRNVQRPPAWTDPGDVDRRPDSFPGRLSILRFPCNGKTISATVHESSSGRPLPVLHFQSFHLQSFHLLNFASSFLSHNSGERSGCQSRKASGVRSHTRHVVAARTGTVVGIDLVVTAGDPVRADEVEGEVSMDSYAPVQQREHLDSWRVPCLDGIAVLVGSQNDPLTWPIWIFLNITQSVGLRKLGNDRVVELPCSNETLSLQS